MIHVAPQPDGGAMRRFRPDRRLLVKGVALIVAALATGLVWRAYQQPDFLIELGNLIMLC